MWLWRRLRSRLYDHEMRKRQEAQQKLEDTKTDVGWGHQIRSYVLDQSRIKDLRTSVEVSTLKKCSTAISICSSKPASSKVSEPHLCKDSPKDCYA